MRKAVIGVAILAVIIVIALAATTSSEPSNERLGPMVQLLGPNGFTLVWMSRSGQTEAVRVRDQGGTVVTEQQVQPKGGRYEARIGGLKPGQRYAYELIMPIETAERTAVASAATPVAFTAEVRTAPAPGEPFRFLVFGDSGNGGPVQYELARLMRTHDANLIIHTGDLVWPDGAAHRYPEQVYRPYADLLARIPLYPCLGNHDFDDNQGEPMVTEFMLPQNGPEGIVPGRLYWFDFSDARFVCINSNETFTVMRDKVAPWLDAVLNDAGDRWKIVYYHHPVYTNGKYTPSGKLRELLLPIFDRHNVALAFNGHNQMYEATYPLVDGNVVEPGRGTVYVTTGTGGAELYSIHGPKPKELRIQNDQEHGFTVVDVTPQAITVRQMGQRNQVLDEFIVPRPHAVEAPGDPAS